MKRISVRMAPLAAALLLLAACGGGGGNDQASKGTPQAKSTDATPTSKPTGGDLLELEVEAEDFAFDRSRVSVPAGADIELKLKNRDEGVPHTVSVYEDDSAQQEIFTTGNVIGEGEERFEFTAPTETGTFYFQCDVHPDMNGDFVVE